MHLPTFDSPPSSGESREAAHPSSQTAHPRSPRGMQAGHISCKGCWLGNACLQHGMDETDLGWLHVNSAQRHLPRGGVVYHAGDAFHSIFAVRSGICKSVAVCSNGQEKIIAFHLPGEMFGLAGIVTGDYTYDALAVEASEICGVPYSQLLTLTLKNQPLQQSLFKVLSSAIGWHRTLLERLESLSAEAKLVAWLFNLSERYARCGYSPDHFPLLMTRVDAGNYLGLAHETVTRILTQLRKAGMIRLAEKDIEIVDREALMRRARDVLPA